DRIMNQAIETWMRSGRHRGIVASKEAPKNRRIFVIRYCGEVEQHCKGNRCLAVLVLCQDFRFRRFPGMDMPHLIAQPLPPCLPWIGIEKPKVLINRTRNNIEIESLRRLRLLEHERSQTLRAGVSQPLFNG